MKKNKKQQPVKRVYVKKSAKWKHKDSANSISNIELLPTPTEPAPQKDTEVQSLAAICSLMDNFNPEQKQRVLKFLCGRYYDFM